MEHLYRKYIKKTHETCFALEVNSPEVSYCCGGKMIDIESHNL